MNINTLQRLSLVVLWLWLILMACIPVALNGLSSIGVEHISSMTNLHPSWEHYWNALNPLNIKIIGRSLLLAFIVTIICLMLAYPFCLCLRKIPERYHNMLMILLIIPFWTNSVIRTYSLIALLKKNGLINKLLLKLGIIHEPLLLLYNNFAVILSMVYNLLPFMILPLFASIRKINYQMIEAGQDLGANKFRQHLSLWIPLAKNGIAAGSMLVFLPSMTLFYIPNIVGGANSFLLGNLFEQQILVAENYQDAAALSIVLIAVSVFIFWIQKLFFTNK